MFQVSPNPILASIGPIDIRYYGLVYALAFLGTYFYLQYLTRKGKLHLDEEAIDNFVLYAIIGVVAGGRIGQFIFYQTQRLFTDPLAVLRIWEGGMSFHGGVIGVAIAITLFCRRYNMPFYQLSDNLVIPGSIALFFGRIANFINAELVGTITNVPWAVNWFGEINPVTGDLIYRHPSQIYEALTNGAQAIILHTLQAKKSFTQQFKVGSGFYTWLFIFMYGAMRLVVNIWREEAEIILGLGMGQLLSLIMAIIALIVIYKNYLNK
jgi:phosphatidylglycerol:prolipoprotein diacylglycerol transferase